MGKKLKFLFGIILMIMFMNGKKMYCEVAKQSNIPVIMQPNSVIEFISETEYKILEGGEYEGEGYESIDYGSEDGVYILKYPIPKAGSKVYYDHEGFVKKFENFEETSDENDKDNACGAVYRNHDNIPQKDNAAACQRVYNLIHNTQIWFRNMKVCSSTGKLDADSNNSTEKNKNFKEPVIAEKNKTQVPVKTKEAVRKVKKEDEREVTDRTFNKEDYYISMTVMEDRDNDRITCTYCYDFSTGKCWKVWENNCVAQYSIMTYDWKNNKVYYMENEGMDENGHLGCDSICAHDLSTGSDEVLTDDFYAINYLIPAEDKLNIIAVARNERPVSLFQYDNKTKEVERAEELDKDLTVWHVSYSPVTNKAAIAGYLEADMTKKMDEANERAAAINDISPIMSAGRYVYTSDDGLTTLDFQFEDEYAIDKFAITPKGKLYYTQSECETNEKPPELWYKYSAGDDILCESYFRKIEGIHIYSHYAVFMDDIHLYCLGYIDDKKAIYCCNVEDGTIEEVVSLENGDINNFVILKKN